MARLLLKTRAAADGTIFGTLGTVSKGGQPLVQGPQRRQLGGIRPIVGRGSPLRVFDGNGLERASVP